MIDRPILFSGPMVRALLDGSKTQTRRVAKGAISEWLDNANSSHKVMDGKVFNYSFDQHLGDCPYGHPGDRLWVRETWAQPTTLDPGPTLYRADYPDCVPAGFENIPAAHEIKWKPSIHMFRRDSRITLEIIDVRVERLLDIGEVDARAEGALKANSPAAFLSNHRQGFRSLWESINGAGSWDANPWVWVVEFRRI